MADNYGVTWLVDPAFSAVTSWRDTANALNNACIFLRTINVRQGLVMASKDGTRTYVDIVDSVFGREVLPLRSRICDDGRAQVYDTHEADSLPNREYILFFTAGTLW
jgi:hypothetical protein